MTGRVGLRRQVRAALLGTSILALLAGCEAGQFGFSGRDAEWERRGAFSVVSASAERAVVSARGNRVAVEPTPGFCLAEDEIETSERSAFVLIGDCVLENAAAGARVAGADGTLDLPPGMPGIITVSISGDPGFSRRGASAVDLSELEAYLDTHEGRALLGRGGDGAQVSVLETRRRGDTLYVLVEDRNGAAVPILAQRFWRAFVELNDRLTVVTVSGFRDVPMGEDEMLRHLGDQVRQLQLANAVPVEEAPIQVAAAPRRPRAGETGSGDAPPEDIMVAEATPEATAPPDDAWAPPALAGLSPDAGPADGAWGSPETAAAEAVALAGGPGSSGEEWAELALADTAAGATRAAVAAGSPGSPDDAWADPEFAGPATTAGAPESAAADAPGDGAEAGDALAEWDEIVPAPRPVVVAATGTGAPGLWPMPPTRPGGAARATEFSAPAPPPRLIDPADRAAGAAPAAGAAVPLPPRRVRR